MSQLMRYLITSNPWKIALGNLWAVIVNDVPWSLPIETQCTCLSERLACISPSRFPTTLISKEFMRKKRSNTWRGCHRDERAPIRIRKHTPPLQYAFRVLLSAELFLPFFSLRIVASWTAVPMVFRLERFEWSERVGQWQKWMWMYGNRYKMSRNVMC